MKPYIKKNKLAYLILFIFLIGFVYIFSKAWPNKEKQRFLSLALGGFYFFWGIFTHTNKNKISTEVIFEYLAVSVLATLIIVLITL